MITKQNSSTNTRVVSLVRISTCRRQSWFHMYAFLWNQNLQAKLLNFQIYPKSYRKAETITCIHYSILIIQFIWTIFNTSIYIKYKEFLILFLIVNLIQWKMEVYEKSVNRAFRQIAWLQYDLSMVTVPTIWLDLLDIIFHRIFDNLINSSVLCVDATVGQKCVE